MNYFNMTQDWHMIYFFIILFGIKQLNKLWKKTFKTILPTVMFRGTPCIKNSCPQFS